MDYVWCYASKCNDAYIVEVCLLLVDSCFWSSADTVFVTFYMNMRMFGTCATSTARYTSLSFFAG